MGRENPSLRVGAHLDMKPYWPSMRVDAMSSSVTPRLSTMLVMSAPDMSRSRLISVPAACLRHPGCVCLLAWHAMRVFAAAVPPGKKEYALGVWKAAMIPAQIMGRVA